MIYTVKSYTEEVHQQDSLWAKVINLLGEQHVARFTLLPDSSSNLHANIISSKVNVVL